jgi:hypothetical protein
MVETMVLYSAENFFLLSPTLFCNVTQLSTKVDGEEEVKYFLELCFKKRFKKT